MPRTDIILRDDDLSIVNGDFEMGVSDPQHVYHIVLNPQGSYKQWPLVGIGRSIINGTFDSILRRRIQVQLESDGYRLKSIKMDEKGIGINFDEV